ncbi:MAG TPA: hypothetical protein VFS37_09165 [Conexibacter sp.]|nr:hypothetical protein [Conexibacter sp.]
MSTVRETSRTGWRDTFVGFWDAICVRGLVLLWFCAMLATALLVLTEPPDVVSGLVFGGIAALAFAVVPNWSLLARESWILRRFFAPYEGLARYYTRHETELRPMGNVSEDVGDYLEEHSSDFQQFVKRRRHTSASRS